MKRLVTLLPFAIAALFSGNVRAQVPLGTVAVSYQYIPSKMLADPERDRVYVADKTNNRIDVINTQDLKVVRSVNIGPAPADMAISRDGKSLYVANSGSTLAAVGVLDLDSLTVRQKFALPGSPVAIAAGLDGRLYVSTSGFPSLIYQLDGATGAVQTTFNQAYYDNDLFQMSPDGKTLFVASDLEPGSLKTFNVSTATPGAAAQVNSSATENVEQMAISHKGKYICLPSGGGNGGGYSTYLFSTKDINAYFGAFDNGAYPGPLAFSPNDKLVYQTGGSSTGEDAGNPLQVFSTATFSKIRELSFPAVSATGYRDKITSIVTDRTGSYLFIGENGDDTDASGGLSTVGQVLVMGTGSGTLKPPVPTVDVQATNPTVIAGSSTYGQFTFTRSKAEASSLVVVYNLTGTAVNGRDYVTLKGKATIKPGLTSQTIDVIPLGSKTPVLTVDLTLLPEPGYEVGGYHSAVIDIYAED